ncbi:MAG TPA: hypothetical protein PK916_17905 [Bacteroidota bacterium]|nr:hypothetical protein [Bacteroidota bacterium]
MESNASIPEPLLSQLKAWLWDSDRRAAEGSAVPADRRVAELHSAFGDVLGGVALDASMIEEWRREAAEERNKPVVEPERGSLQGVDGWLYAFIFLRLYVNPVLMGLLLLLNSGWILDVFSIISQAQIELVATLGIALLSPVLIAWGAVAAYRLKVLKPRSVQFMKVFLLVEVATVVLMFVTISMVGDFDPMSIVSPIVGTSLTYAYFTVSRRVKATYPDATEPLWSRG